MVVIFILAADWFIVCSMKSLVTDGRTATPCQDLGLERSTDNKLEVYDPSPYINVSTSSHCCLQYLLAIHATTVFVFYILDGTAEQQTNAELSISARLLIEWKHSYTLHPLDITSWYSIPLYFRAETLLRSNISRDTPSNQLHSPMTDGDKTLVYSASKN